MELKKYKFSLTFLFLACFPAISYSLPVAMVDSSVTNVEVGDIQVGPYATLSNRPYVSKMGKFDFNFSLPGRIQPVGGGCTADIFTADMSLSKSLLKVQYSIVVLAKATRKKITVYFRYDPNAPGICKIRKLILH